MKRVLSIHRAPPMHWVGDGFPVRSLFAYDRFGDVLSPFLLLDYAAPAEFAPTAEPHGVGVHPHRGFETVTIAYQGRIAHRDSAGNEGVIGPGDVQWMTAGRGILHEEFHEREFAATGGTVEMVQLWVNLPRADKRTPPRYQDIGTAQIPTVTLADGAGTVRVIAGELRGVRGPAATFSSLNVWDGVLRGGRSTELELARDRTGVVVLLDGELEIAGTATLTETGFAILDPAGEGLGLRAARDARFLVLDGAPLGEPIAGRGPFVMNTEAEIHEAFEDLRAGRFP